MSDDRLWQGVALVALLFLVVIVASVVMPEHPWDRLVKP